MKTALSQITAAAITAALAISFAGAASADSPKAPADFAVKFHYNTSELATRAGQEALLKRMEATIRQECAVPTSAPLVSVEIDKCVTKTMHGALKSFHSDELASLYTGRTAG